MKQLLKHLSKYVGGNSCLSINKHNWTIIAGRGNAG